MENNEQQNGFTPEQQAELEAVRLQRVQAETELIRLQNELSETQRQEREKRQRQVIRDAASATAKFHDLDIAEHIVKDYDLVFDEQTGEATGLVDGKRVGLSDIFKKIALDHPNLVDGRSLRHLQDAQERQQAEAEIACKAEMSVEQKIAYIDQHGLEKFEALPLRRPRITTVRTFSDYLALPLKDRIKWVEKHGSDASAKLPRK